MKSLKCNVNSVNVIEDRGGEIQVLISPKTVGSSQLVMGVSRLPVNAVIKNHIHDYSEESFFVLKGEGVIHLQDRESIDFKAGDAVLVPKGVAHTIINTGDETLEVIFSVAPLAPSPELGHRNITL